MSLPPETIKALDDQVREIAQHLGMEFDQEHADRQEQTWNYHAEIKSDNKRISFSTGGYKKPGRFVIRGEFPRDKKGQFQHNYHDKHSEITVAMDRGSEKIAHAIQSRLLPEYEKQLVGDMKRIEESNAYHADRLQVLQKVAEYFGQSMPEDDDRAIYPGPGWGVYRIEAIGNGEIKFDVSVSMAKAISIFDILRG